MRFVVGEVSSTSRRITCGVTHDDDDGGAAPIETLFVCACANTVVAGVPSSTGQAPIQGLMGGAPSHLVRNNVTVISSRDI